MPVGAAYGSYQGWRRHGRFSAGLSAGSADQDMAGGRILRGGAPRVRLHNPSPSTVVTELPADRCPAASRRT